MKKIMIYSSKCIDEANELAGILFSKYKYDVSICINKDILTSIRLSNNNIDDLFIKLNNSTDNYTYLSYWEKGKYEKELVDSINEYVSCVNVPVDKSHYPISCLDAEFIDVDISSYSNLGGIARGIYNFLGE